MPDIRFPVSRGRIGTKPLFKQPKVIEGRYHCPECGARLEYNHVTQSYQCLAPRDPQFRPYGSTPFNQPVCGYDIPLSRVYPRIN